MDPDPATDQTPFFSDSEKREGSGAGSGAGSGSGEVKKHANPADPVPEPDRQN